MDALFWFTGLVWWVLIVGAGLAFVITWTLRQLLLEPPHVVRTSGPWWRRP